jgi:inhibitor of cysteine peptidase
MRTALLAALAFALGACASPPKTGAAAIPPAPASAFVELVNAEDGTRVALKKGGELKVVLDANPSTGFQWQGPPNVAPLLSPIGQRIYVSKSTNPMDLGAGGSNIFRYRAEDTGKSTLTMEYRRPWEGAPGKTVRYEVNVE